MDRDGTFVFIVGIILGISIGAVVTLNMAIYPKLNECEKELPRNERCILTAIPEAE